MAEQLATTAMADQGQQERRGALMLEKIDAVIALTDCEGQELHACEAIIERGLKTFYEVGTALLTIRDQRLYRDTHNTFEDYCRERWSIGHSHAQRMIDAAKVVENLSPIGDTLKPTHESQLRPLTSLEPEEQRSVWSHAVAESNGRQPTAAKVQESVLAHVQKLAKGASQAARATSLATLPTKPKYVPMSKEEEDAEYDGPFDGDAIHFLCFAIAYIAGKTEMPDDAEFVGFAPNEMVTLGREYFSRKYGDLAARAQKVAAWLTAVAKEAGKQ